jgi:hypothetical protein
MLLWQVAKIAALRGIHTWRARYEELLRADARARTPRDHRAVAREDRALVAEALAAVAAQRARLAAERARFNALIDRSGWPTTPIPNDYGGSEVTAAERRKWPPGLPLDDLRWLVRIEHLDAQIRELRRVDQGLDRAALRASDLTH